jgi:hypothetical protein
MVVDPDAAALRALVRSLPQERFYASPEALVEALAHETQFNIIDMHTGWKVDLIPRKRRAFSQTEFSRRRRLDVLGTSLWVASLEDTILAKLEWAKAAGGSERQREDVRALLGLGVATLDPDYVQRWVDELDLADEWARVRPASG